MLRRDHIGIEPPTFQQIENAATNTIIDMLMVVGVTLADHIFDKRRDIEHQFVIKQFDLYTRRDIQFMIAALIVIRTDSIRGAVYNFLIQGEVYLKNFYIFYILINILQI